jgi:hypothetical protein
LAEFSGLLFRLPSPTAVTLGVTPRHRQDGLVSTLARSLVTETNVSPVFFAQIQTQVDLDASSPLRSAA